MFDATANHYDRFSFLSIHYPDFFLLNDRNVLTDDPARYEMNSLKKLEIRKVKDLLSSKEEVGKVRASLEQRTEKAFNEFAKLKQKVQEMAHQKYLD